jgi:hypothetical protein
MTGWGQVPEAIALLAPWPSPPTTGWGQLPEVVVGVRGGVTVSMSFKEWLPGSR